MCVCVLGVSDTIVRTGYTLAKIQIVKNNYCRFYHLPSNGVIGLNLLFEGHRFEWRPSHSGERPFTCDESEYCCISHIGERPYKCDECKYCCTQSSSLARHTDTSDEYEFKCTEGDIYSKANRSSGFRPICLHLYGTRRRVALVEFTALRSSVGHCPVFYYRILLRTGDASNDMKQRANRRRQPTGPSSNCAVYNRVHNYYGFDPATGRG